MHGHQDRGALVWHTLGVPVLDDPGTFVRTGAYATWSTGTLAHSVQVPYRRPFSTSAAVRLTPLVTTGARHVLRLTDAQWGQTHVRTWTIDAAAHRVSVTDRTASRATTLLHLAPGWSVTAVTADRRTVRLRHPSGRTAVVTGTAAITVYRGSTRPVAGWSFPDMLSRVPAVQLSMASAAGASTLTITVR